PHWLKFLEINEEIQLILGLLSNTIVVLIFPCGAFDLVLQFSIGMSGMRDILQGPIFIIHFSCLSELIYAAFLLFFTVFLYISHSIQENMYIFYKVVVNI
ncbi:hypothetical protein ACJX0J_017985, partial [Zea mays]